MILEAQLLVLLVKRDTEERGVDQFCRIFEAQLLVLLVKRPIEDTEIDQFWRILAL